MRESDLLALARTLMTLPTVPFREGPVRERIRSFCQERGMQIREDDMGNLLVLPAGLNVVPQLAFAAHMDHPGFIVERTARNGRVFAVFHGDVQDEYFATTAVVAHTAHGPVRGRVAGVPSPLRPRGKRVELRLDGPVQPGDAVVWGVPVWRVRNGTLSALACDDLAGCAAVLALLDICAVHSTPPPVAALFTVAEEAGLHGAIAACRSGFLPRGLPVVSVETSREWPFARRGCGAIVRTGDRRSVFHDGLLRYILHAAQGVAQQNSGFAFQRKLMDGGTCESSIYQAFGYVTAGVCIPLGNYHNRDYSHGRIAPEKVAVSDLRNLVDLFVGMVERLDEVSFYLKSAPPTYGEQKGTIGERFMVQNSA